VKLCCCGPCSRGSVAHADVVLHGGGGRSSSCPPCPAAYLPRSAEAFHPQRRCPPAAATRITFSFARLPPPPALLSFITWPPLPSAPPHLDPPAISLLLP
jgi:hypothetical protein